MKKTALYTSTLILLLTLAVTNSVHAATLHVRYQDNVAFSGTLDLPEATTTSLNDSSGNPHDINSSSALYLLSLAQASSTAFSISDLQYYSSFGSFYVNCLDIINSTTTHACGNWQYAVNNVTPYVGSDQYLATSTDDIYFYYGNQRQFSVSTTSTDTDTPILVNAEKYDYTNNLWVPLENEVVNATQPNPSDQWNPLIIASSTTNASGTASLLLTSTGTYNIGLSSDGYYPTTVTISTTSTSTEIVSEVTNSPSGGSSNSSNNTKVPDFDVSAAVSFLSSKQNSDGSFGNDLYTDWSAIALGSYGSSAAKNKIYIYLKNQNFSGDSITDYERHAMALLALNINPYSGTDVDYIKKITDSFDGEQIGDPDLYNDDIFALFPLLKTGYNTSDKIVLSTVQFIISKQSGDGSWGSVDLTAAAIQALAQVRSINGVSDALAKAKTFLKSKQKDGGFETSFSTSWTLQAINSLGENSNQWKQGEITPMSFLTLSQQNDGGVEATSTSDSNRLWATAYAIPAVLNKDWPTILHEFPRPTTQTSDSPDEPKEKTATSTEINTVISTSTTIIQPLVQIEELQPITVKNFPKKENLKIVEKVVLPIATSVLATTSPTTYAAVSTVENTTSTKNIFAIILLLVGFLSLFYFYKIKYN